MYWARFIRKQFWRPSGHNLAQAAALQVSARQCKTSICGLRPESHPVYWRSSFLRHGGGGSGAWFPGVRAAAGTEAAEDRAFSEVPTASRFLVALPIIFSLTAAKLSNLVDVLPNPSRPRCAVLLVLRWIRKVSGLGCGGRPVVGSGYRCRVLLGKDSGLACRLADPDSAYLCMLDFGAL
jgi:hypothetical protein